MREVDESLVLLALGGSEMIRAARQPAYSAQVRYSQTGDTKVTARLYPGNIRVR